MHDIDKNARTHNLLLFINAENRPILLKFVNINCQKCSKSKVTIDKFPLQCNVKLDQYHD